VRVSLKTTGVLDSSGKRKLTAGVTHVGGDSDRKKEIKRALTERGKLYTYIKADIAGGAIRKKSHREKERRCVGDDKGGQGEGRSRLTESAPVDRGGGARGVG